MSDVESNKEPEVEPTVNAQTENGEDNKDVGHENSVASESHETDSHSDVTDDSFKDAEDYEEDSEAKVENEEENTVSKGTPNAEAEEIASETTPIEETETLQEVETNTENFAPEIVDKEETDTKIDELKPVKTSDKETEEPEASFTDHNDKEIIEKPSEASSIPQVEVQVPEQEEKTIPLDETPATMASEGDASLDKIEKEQVSGVAVPVLPLRGPAAGISVPVLPPREQTAGVSVPVLPPRESTPGISVPVLPPRENTVSIPVIADYKLRQSITEEEAVYINTNDVPKASTLKETELSTMNVPAKSMKNWFKFKIGADSKESDNEEVLNKLAHPANYDLALYRFEGNEESLKYISEKSREQVSIAHESLRNTFNVIKSGIEYTNNDALIKGIDWEFWTEIANDYSKVVKEKPNELLVHITNGIPSELRGMIWQLITNSKSFELEEIFRDSKDKDSSYAKAIRRDLVRTSFVRDSAVVSKIEDLYDVLKAYTLFDPEVGYTQGMAFITVPLLMNMGAHEAFSLLVCLMKNYGFRELYLPEMPGLHLKLYQFDRLLEDLCPDLHIHLSRQGVRSSMYVTQWFLTLFGYKFPLELVLRIFDVAIAEGIDCILKFAINLMLQSKDHILKLNFDSLLPFLKEKIFFHYLIRSADSSNGSEPSSPNSDSEITLETYDLEAFVKDAMSIRILPLTLNRYSAEYDEIHRIENERKQEIDELRSKNGHLMQEIRNIEASYALMNREHVDVVNEMVKGKVLIANLEEENKQLSEELVKLNTRIESLEIEVEQNKSKEKSKDQLNIDSTNFEGVNLELEIQNTMARNLEVMEENRLLEEQLASLEEEYNKTKSELDNLKVSHKDLKLKWGSLKKNFW